MAPKAAAAPEMPATPPPPTSGTGKFFYLNGATYEGEWRFLLPEPVATPEEGKKKPAKGKAPEPEDPASTLPPKRVRHGQGTYTEGAYKYEGAWVDDQMQGQGKFTFASGSAYMGFFNQGKYHGEGTYSWADGRKYQGSWQDGQMHGNGAYQDAEGHTWSGQFFNGSGPGLTCHL